MRRLGALAAVLLAPALPLLASPPAHAATTVLCVNRPATDTDCGARPATVQAAIAAAAGDGTDSVIRIGPGTYTDGPYTFDGSTSPLTVQGSGNGSGSNATILQAGPASPRVTATGATIRNLRILVGGAGGVGLDLSGATGHADKVYVSDTAAAPATDTVGIRVAGAKVEDSTVNLDRAPGGTGLQTSGTAVVSRSTARAATGIVAVSGELDVDNSVLEVAPTGQVGLRAGTEASTAPTHVDAEHLTVVGGGAGSRGVWAFTDDAGVGASVDLDNSIVRGQTHSLAAAAPAGGSATVTARYSDVQLATSQQTGAGTVVADPATNVDVDPAFVDPGRDHRLRAGSPVVDKASLLVSTGNDRDGLGRAFDGDRNGSAIPDLGAYELRDLDAPSTTLTGGPQGPTNDNTPLFTFQADDQATFECQLDAGAWQKCGSPATTPPLPDGRHTFSVRATDEVRNVEPTPATRSFTVDTRVPNATITKKPAKRFSGQRVKFKFAADETGATFQCNLDGRGWKPCRATFRFNTKVGKHVLLVRARDAAGNVDPTPARYKYKRLARRN